MTPDRSYSILICLNNNGAIVPTNENWNERISPAHIYTYNGYENVGGVDCYRWVASGYTDCDGSYDIPPIYTEMLQTGELELVDAGSADPEWAFHNIYYMGGDVASKTDDDQLIWLREYAPDLQFGIANIPYDYYHTYNYINKDRCVGPQVYTGPVTPNQFRVHDGIFYASAFGDHDDGENICLHTEYYGGHIPNTCEIYIADYFNVNSRFVLVNLDENVEYHSGDLSRVEVFYTPVTEYGENYNEPAVMSGYCYMLHSPDLTNIPFPKSIYVESPAPITFDIGEQTYFNGIARITYIDTGGVETDIQADNNKISISPDSYWDVGIQSVDSLDYTDVNTLNEDVIHLQQIAPYDVTVTTPRTLSSITVSGQRTSFTVGETWVFGGTVTAHWSDSTTTNVTDSASFSGGNTSTAGTKTVTVSFEGEETSYQITVTVPRTLSSITVSNPQTSFKYGDTFTIGTGTVSAHWSDDTTTNVTSSASFSGYNMLPSLSQVGSQTVTVSYTSDVTKTTTYSINVDKVLHSIYVNSPKTTFYLNDTWTLDIGYIIVGWNDDALVNRTTIHSSDPEFANVEWTGNNTSTLGHHDVIASYSYNGVTKTYSYDINVKNRVSSITINNPKTSFAKGESWTFGGTVTLHYLDGSTATSPSNKLTFSGGDTSTTGTKTVTVTYHAGDGTPPVSDTYQINVAAAAVTSISISGYQTSFILNEPWVFGGTVTANYSDGTHTNVTGSAAFSGGNTSTSGTKTVTVSFGGKTATYTINVANSDFPIWCQDGYDDWIIGDGVYTFVNNNPVYEYNGVPYYRYSNSYTYIYVPKDNPNATTSQIYTFLMSGDHWAGEEVGVWTNISNVGIWHIANPIFNNPTLSSITVLGQQTSFILNEPWVFGGIVTANYSDGTHTNVTSSATFSGGDTSTAGTKTVTVTYAEDGYSASDSYQITVTLVHEWIANISDIEEISEFPQTGLRTNIENNSYRCPTYRQIMNYGTAITLVSSPHFVYTDTMLVRCNDLKKRAIGWQTICDIQFTSSTPKDTISNKFLTMNSTYGNYDSTYNSLYKGIWGGQHDYSRAPANLDLSGTPLKTFATNYTNETYRITFEFPYPSVSNTNIILCVFNNILYTFTLTSEFKNIIEYGQIYKYIIEGTKAGDCIVTVYDSSDQQVFTQVYTSYSGFHSFTTQVASYTNIYFLPNMFSDQGFSQYYLKSFKVEVLYS